jgi:hypothetical protein
MRAPILPLLNAKAHPSPLVHGADSPSISYIDALNGLGEKPGRDLLRDRVYLPLARAWRRVRRDCAARIYLPHRTAYFSDWAAIVKEITDRTAGEVDYTGVIVRTCEDDSSSAVQGSSYHSTCSSFLPTPGSPPRLAPALIGPLSSTTKSQYGSMWDP